MLQASREAMVEQCKFLRSLLVCMYIPKSYVNLMQECSGAFAPAAQVGSSDDRVMRTRHRSKRQFRIPFLSFTASRMRKIGNS